MKTYTKNLTIRMPLGVYAALKQLAKEDQCTISSYIRRLIWEHINEKDVPIFAMPQEKK